MKDYLDEVLAYTNRRIGHSHKRLSSRPNVNSRDYTVYAFHEKGYWEGRLSALESVEKLIEDLKNPTFEQLEMVWKNYEGGIFTPVHEETGDGLVILSTTRMYQAFTINSKGELQSYTQRTITDELLEAIQISKQYARKTHGETI